MSLNEIIQSTRFSVSQLVQEFRSKELYVDNSFQRRLVWTEKQKVRLIETVLIGYPMPEIYIWQQAADADTGKQVKSIVDGQQRISTLAQFVSNEWKLTASYLDNAECAFANQYWKDLAPEMKQRVWDYLVNVRSIPSTVESSEITAIFMRLNETDKSLNPQELRHAEFNGKFIKNAERIADLPEFSELNAFSDHQIRRMRDIEFVSGLLMFLRRGEMDESPKSINDTYDMYNDRYEEAEEDFATIKKFLLDCKHTYFSSESVRTMFSKPVHLYSLFCLDQTLLQRQMTPNLIAEHLPSFVEAYENKPGYFEAIEDYRTGAASRTRSASSRGLRLASLTKWVLRKDPGSLI